MTPPANIPQAPPNRMLPGASGLSPMMPPSPTPATGAPAPSPAQVDEARRHSRAMVDGLSALVAKPRGDLTKKDVFDAASDMIAKGAFPTPESRQLLVAEMAKLPDDEPQMRKALGRFLLDAAANQIMLHQIHGAGDAGV